MNIFVSAPEKTSKGYAFYDEFGYELASRGANIVSPGPRPEYKDQQAGLDALGRLALMRTAELVLIDAGDFFGAADDLAAAHIASQATRVVVAYSAPHDGRTPFSIEAMRETYGNRMSFVAYDGTDDLLEQLEASYAADNE